MYCRYKIHAIHIEVKVEINKKCINDISDLDTRVTCSVLMCLSLNLSSTYRRATDVLPTHPSPSKTTLKLYPLAVLMSGLAIILRTNFALATENRGM